MPKIFPRRQSALKSITPGTQITPSTHFNPNDAHDALQMRHPDSHAGKAVAAKVVVVEKGAKPSPRTCPPTHSTQQPGSS
eukprot:350908-Chlamydomonas_euryale.AAC.3